MKVLRTYWSLYFFLFVKTYSMSPSSVVNTTDGVTHSNNNNTGTATKNSKNLETREWKQIAWRRPSYRPSMSYYSSSPGYSYDLYKPNNYHFSKGSNNQKEITSTTSLNVASKKEKSSVPTPAKKNVTVLTESSTAKSKPRKCFCGLDSQNGLTRVQATKRKNGIKSPQKRSAFARIAGGTASKDHAWPWMAAIVYKETGKKPFWFCGGSIINNKYILTAAHCIKSMERKGLPKIQIYIGTNEIFDTEKTIMNISKVLPHPKYSRQYQTYDIGLIKLTKEINFSDTISPVCLSQKGAPFLGNTATVAGWGSIVYGEKPPDSLREVDVRVVSNIECYHKYMKKYGMPISFDMLCAWLPGKDSCQGDSGGPLFRRLTPKDSYTQIGVVSFGPPQCGATDIPGVYSRISSSLHWIKTNTKDATYCDAI